MVHADGAPSHGAAERTYHTFNRKFEEASKTPDDLKCEVLNGKLLLTWRGKTEEIKLPDDAYTNDYVATLEKDELVVKIGQRSPDGPAMQEKQALDPDGPNPRALIIKLLDPQHNIPPPDVMGHGQPSPAQVELGEHTTNDLLLSPLKGVAMPEAGMADSVVTDNPVFISTGGVMASPSSGETVVRKPEQVDTHTDTSSKVVIQGTREQVLQAEHDADKDNSTTAAMGALGLQDKDTNKTTFGSTEPAGKTSADAPPPPVAAEPAGAEDEVYDYEDEYEEGYESGDYLESDEFIDDMGIVHKKVDETTEKVGLATHAVTAAERYPRADDSTHEPISSMKQQATGNAHACDLCDCAPCQCDKISKTSAAGFEMTAPETKHAGGYAPKHHKNANYAHKQKVPRTNRRSNMLPPQSDMKSRVAQRSVYYDNTEKTRLHAEPSEDVPSREDFKYTRSGVQHPANTLGEGDEQQTLPKPKGSAYTGGRVIGGTENISLTSGDHKPPHVLG